MAKQNQQDVAKNLKDVLAGGITQAQLDAWKEKHGFVHIITVTVDQNKSLTGYFKKPKRDILANCVNLSNNGQTFEAKDFLANNTFLGGDQEIMSDEDASISAAARLWLSLNFLKAEAVKY